jgi:hypothetical protein
MSCFTRLVWLLLMVGVSGCSDRHARAPTGSEQLSTVAPDGSSRAFVWLPESGGYLGATVSPPYQVWLQSSRYKEDESLILAADKTTGLRLYWSGTNELVICYVKAQISRFRNFFVVAKDSSPEIYSVEVLLRKVAKLDDCHASDPAE